MSVEGEINGLYPTPVRVRLLVAIRDEPGRIHGHARQAYDDRTGGRVTSRLREMVDAGWVRARTADEPLLKGEWSQTRTYYRLTDLGRAAIERGKR